MKVCKSEKPEKTFKAFCRYVTWIRVYAEKEKANLESREFFLEEDYDTYAYCAYLLEQDAIFYKKLSNEEKESLGFLFYHNPNEEKPYLYEFRLQTAYRKYLTTFFPKKDPQLSYVVLGSIMRILRIRKGETKTYLAEVLGVDRTAVGFYEGGRRSPSLDYMYKFCKHFGCSIDEMVKNSFK